jgi:hypothetical protein
MLYCVWAAKAARGASLPEKRITAIAATMT